MIKWKSLGIFFLTLFILLGLVLGAGWFGYAKALDFLYIKFPEVRVTPKNSAVYEPDDSIIKDFVEYKDSGYSIKVPKNCRVVKKRKDPTIYISDKSDVWKITVYEKLHRYEDTIKSDKYITNSEGDYYVLFDSIFKSTKDPILLFQKRMYLPSDTKHIKYIRTPAFIGFYIVGESGDYRTEYYRLFDENCWHNVAVAVDMSKVSHKFIQSIIATLKNDESEEETE